METILTTSASGAAAAAPAPTLARNPLVPLVATIEKVIDETDSGSVRNFLVRLDDPAAHEAISYRPGQCGMISVIGVGESMIALASTPTRKGPLEFAVKAAGRNTNALHEMKAGQKVGVRLAYGNGFDTEAMKGKDLIFVGGGIGMSGLRSLINYCLDRRGDFGRLTVVYGARSPGELCFKEDIFENWPKAPGIDVNLTVDVGDDQWKGPVALIPPYLESLNPSPQGSLVVVCGPPVMIRFTLLSLAKLGFTDEQIIMTLELKMQCGIGKCGRCNIGSRYVCLDGPVFTLAELKRLPNEY